MSATNDILERYGGTEVNSLTHVIGNDIEIDILNTNQIPSVKNYPYMNNEEFISFCGKHQNNFSILSLNIQSLRAKFNEFEVLVETLRNNGCKLSIICLQETWLTENSSLSGLQIEGYEFIFNLLDVALMLD